MLKDFAIALSLANLCFFMVWVKLLSISPEYEFFMKAPPSPSEHAAVILTVLLLASVFWTMVTVARRTSFVQVLNLARWTFLLVLIVVLNSIRQQFGGLSLFGLLEHFGTAGLAILGLGSALFTLFILVRWHRFTIRTATTIVLVLSPFALVTLSQAGWSILRYDDAFSKFADKPLAQAFPVRKRSAPRVLWLVFDGMDQRQTFVEHPPTVKLSEIDRFRSQSIYARNAYPPASNTMLSMPSLITGRLVSDADPVSTDELMIIFADSKEAVGWSTQPNMFSKARELGLNTAVVGWYLPYCRVLSSNLTTCSWQPGGWRPIWTEAPELTLSEGMANVIPTLVNTIPLAWRFQWPQRLAALLGLGGRVEHIKHYLSILDEAKKAATNPDLGLILVHWPVPHQFYIYNRFKGDFTSYGDNDYFDNLVLVDKTMGELRRAMERAGTWENSTVLITSDHWNKKAKKTDHRVPFLIKLAGQKEAIIYDSVFNTILIYELILKLLRGELSGSDNLVNWLDQHHSIGESPL